MQYLIDSGIKVDAVICDPPYGIFGKGDNSQGLGIGGYGSEKQAKGNELSWDVLIPLDQMWNKINNIINRQNANVILFGDEKFSYELRKSNERGFRYNIIWDKISGGIGIYAKHQPIKQFEYISVFGSPFNYDIKMKEYHYKILKATGKTKKEIAELFNKVQVSNTFLEEDNKESKSLSKIMPHEYNILIELVGDKMNMMSYEEYKSFWTPPVYNPQMIKTSKKIVSGGKGGRYESVMNTKGITRPRNELYPTNIWPFKKVTSSALHPTQKPIPLMEELILTYTNEGDTILDFTCGSGSTLVACKNTGHKCIGIELQQKYCDITIKRLENIVIKTDEPKELDIFDFIN